MNGLEMKGGLENAGFEAGEDVEKGEIQNGKGLNEKSQASQEVEEEDRAQWGHGIEFLMSCIAMSVGLGNIWRFPFTAYENGGGAFLIPYIIVLTIIGRPLYYMEMTIGQFTSRGNVKAYSAIAPLFKGVGYGQLIGTISVATYYCCLMAITLFYLTNSFTSDLPWTDCLESWEPYLKSINKTCISSKSTSTEQGNSISSSEMWFKKQVLHQVDDISDGLGAPEWKLTLCLLASWIITLLVSVKGVQSSGKASYFLAIFPYVVMITLLIRAATLPGASEGMYYFIKTDWNKLLDANVWYAAVTQCFFSLNVGFGSIIMYSSYNNFDHNINRDAVVVTTLDTFTSLLSGVTIFGILGNLAYELGVTPDKVINSGGTGLAFISYPEAIAKFQAVPWLFAILFFFMLFVLGIGSLVALQGCVNTVISDAFPNLPMWKITTLTAAGGFLIGLVYVTPGGQYILDLVDFFGGTFIVYAFAILEVVSVCWIYGIDNFCLDLQFMTKSKVSIYWRLTWGLITPSLLIIIFVYFLATIKPLTYGMLSLSYPDGALAVGWMILVVGLLQMTIWTIYYYYQNRSYPKKQILSRMFVGEKWGPKNKRRYEEWIKFKEEAKKAKAARNRSWFQNKLDILLGRY